MPIYEYSCGECDEQFEKFVRSMTSTVAIKCPKCGSVNTKKGWSAFATSGTNGGLDSYAPPASSCSPGGT